MPTSMRPASHILRFSMVIVFIVVGVAGGAQVTDRFLVDPGDGPGLLISEVLYRPDGGNAESVYFAASGATLDLPAGLIRGTNLQGKNVDISLTSVEWIRIKLESANPPKQVVLRLDAVLDPSTWKPRGRLTRVVLQGDTTLEYDGVAPEVRDASRDLAWTSTGECEVLIPWEYVLWIEFLRPDTYLIEEEVPSTGEPSSALLKSGTTVDLEGRRGCLDVVAGVLRCGNPVEDIQLSDVRTLQIQSEVGSYGPGVLAGTAANPTPLEGELSAATGSTPDDLRPYTRRGFSSAIKVGIGTANEPFPGDGRDSGVGLALRFGVVFAERFLVSLEPGFWKSLKYSDRDVVSVPLSLTYYPRADGWFVRGAIGPAWNQQTNRSSNPVLNGLPTFLYYGTSVSIGVGWEWWLKRSSALGLVLDYTAVPSAQEYDGMKMENLVVLSLQLAAY